MMGLEGASEEPRLAGELGADDASRGQATGLGVDGLPVLRQPKSDIVVGTPDEPCGGLVVPSQSNKRPISWRHSSASTRVTAPRHRAARRA
jgi:hypothetical protein